MVIDPLDSTPSTVSSGLTSLGVETSGKRVRVGQFGTIALQVIFRDAPLIHPFAQAFVADELYHADGLVNGKVLRLVPSHLVLVCQHASCPFVSSLLPL